MQTTSILLDHVNFHYRIRRPKPLKSIVKREIPTISKYALNDVNLSIKRGERVALLGRNGAGKTTLLRICAGVMPPTSGRLEIKGSVGLLIDADFAVDPELSGSANSYTYGIIRGLNRSEARDYSNQVAEVAELGAKFFEPVKTYSQGMGARLVFGLSISLAPEIMVIDEGIGTADAEFQAKAERLLAQFWRRHGTLLLASHNTALLSTVCDRGIVLDSGMVTYDGPLQDAIRVYKKIGLA